MLLSTVSNIFGAIILIAIVVPWFLIAIGGILVLYALTAIFYRQSAREIKVRANPLSIYVPVLTTFKRLDAILRSSLYAH